MDNLPRIFWEQDESLMQDCEGADGDDTIPRWRALLYQTMLRGQLHGYRALMSQASHALKAAGCADETLIERLDKAVAEGLHRQEKR